MPWRASRRSSSGRWRPVTFSAKRTGGGVWPWVRGGKICSAIILAPAPASPPTRPARRPLEMLRLRGVVLIEGEMRRDQVQGTGRRVQDTIDALLESRQTDEMSLLRVWPGPRDRFAREQGSRLDPQAARVREV